MHILAPKTFYLDMAMVPSSACFLALMRFSPSFSTRTAKMLIPRSFVSI
jgi:hypothetical protein